MPRYRRKKYTRKRKRRYTKKKRSRRSGFSSGKPYGFPGTRRVKMRYSEVIFTASGAGVLTKYKFRANSVFDPNETDVGHSIPAFAQWSALYGSYTVLGSKIGVKFTRPCASSADPVNAYVGVYLSDSSSDSLIVSELKENRTGTNALGTGKAFIGYEKAPRAMSWFSTKKFFNVKDVKDNSQFKSAITTNPADQAHFIVYSQATDTSSTIALDFHVTIDYIVEFSDPHLIEN